MNETRYNEETGCYDIVIRFPFSTKAIDELTKIHGIDGTDGLIAIACEECLLLFAKELAKTGVDKKLIAKEVMGRGAGRIPITMALGIKTNYETL